MKIIVLLALCYIVWSCATTRQPDEPKNRVNKLGPNKW